ncbi:oxidoreductase, NAD-binding Rossmann fold, GFO_IDH_MocA family protein [Nitritalea halalkaliphila LW7]|uniref:Oxidoreductase, NAD-binding Rossmann fold, GFO_IDH_MocA family protein n=1 Tax=Nitritalea halalkaliphila LW7 TaxID=1189621 RepID=I5BZ55_9BACT|nr:Gfo/Idh/MocA family oxidoreductase [Nitritalea halalkaliphila]EIM74857.1 oxidoreductase, NAD-binding Rossmann fold, GFO_IDH_MocA family protein [Nitritalea halalkaliphila LW7]
MVQRHGDEAKTLYPDVEIYRSLEDLLAADAADLVVILTPNALHFPQAKLALEAGKHVVVDKPVTVHAAEAEELQRLAVAKGLVLTVFQNRRWDGDFQTVRALVREERLGRLCHFESHFDRFRPEVGGNWREQAVPGNGITYDLGTHLIDQAYVLFGAPEALEASILVQREGTDADDFFDIRLFYPGLYVRLTASVLMAAPWPRFLLGGTAGTYQKFGLDVQEKAFKAGILPEGPDWGQEDPERYGQLFTGEQVHAVPTVAGDYRKFYANVAAAIRGEAALEVRMEEAIAVLRLVEAARRSQEMGRRLSASEIFG